ncbi:MAG: glycosyl transferase, partial [Candidatus Sericytochromatia bacterium]
GDGEDDPADVPRLLARFEAEDGRLIVFARRQKRSESRGFKVAYFAYRRLYHALTGKVIRVGNFSVLPALMLHRLTVVSELWNHYAAGIFKARLPYCELPVDRAPRLLGRSKMNFAALVIHGLSSISVFADTAATRLLILSAGLGGLTLAGLVGVVAIRFLTPLAIPGWATMAAGILVLLLGQMVIMCMFFAMMVLASRNGPHFIPCKDFQLFVDDVRPLPHRAPTNLRP